MSQCSRCGAPFSCGVKDGPSDAPCWCMELPRLPVDDCTGRYGAASCLCPTCLRALLAAQAEPRQP